MKKIIVFSLLMIFITVFTTYSQPTLPSIDLYIANIPQDTQCWCWAAVAQQIITKYRGISLTQCYLVAKAKNLPVSYCCQNSMPCRSMLGHLNEIRYLIQLFGGRYSSIAPPTHPTILYGALQQGKAIIISVQTSPSTSHVIVIRGMRWLQTNYGLKAVLLINDPMNYYSSEVFFDSILSSWHSAIVVY